MNIIAHRGLWKNVNEKNTMIAFEKALDSNFGIETDVRDYNGKLVISHDMASEGNIKFEELLQLYNLKKSNAVLAINIKADGLQKKMKELLEKYNVKNYFVFDMSVPEMIQYNKHNLIMFTRESEFELRPSFYEEAKGIWLDEFKEHWITKEKVLEHLNNNKEVCIVSPELHKRDYKCIWNEYKDLINDVDSKNLSLCTDYPIEARSFFYE